MDLADSEALVARARFHGVASLLYESGWRDVPGLRESALAFTAWEMRDRQLVTDAVYNAEHAAGGVPPHHRFEQPAGCARASRAELP